MNMHLTEDQIDDALLGDLAEDRAAHLAGCETCRHRLSEAAAPMESFNAVSLAWSERRSATLPAPAAASARTAWLPRALWGATAAAALAVGITVPALRRSAGDHIPEAAGPQAAAPTLMAASGPVDNPVAAREEQIAHDNQILESMHRDLEPASSPGAEYGWQLDRVQASAHRGSAPVRN